MFSGTIVCSRRDIYKTCTRQCQQVFQNEVHQTTSSQLHCQKRVASEQHSGHSEIDQCTDHTQVTSLPEYCTSSYKATSLQNSLPLKDSANCLSNLDLLCPQPCCLRRVLPMRVCALPPEQRCLLMGACASCPPQVY